MAELSNRQKQAYAELSPELQEIVKGYDPKTLKMREDFDTSGMNALQRSVAAKFAQNYAPRAAGAAFANENSAAYKNRKAYQAALTGNLSEKDSLRLARNAELSLRRDLQDRYGKDVADSITGNITYYASQADPYAVNAARLMQSEAYNEDPLAASRYAIRQLALDPAAQRRNMPRVDGSSTGSKRDRTVEGQVGNVLVTSYKSRGGQKIFEGYVTNDDGTMNLNPINLNDPENVAQGLQTFGYGLTEDQASQLSDLVGKGRTYTAFDDLRDDLDYENVVLQRGYKGQDPRYIGEEYAGTPYGTITGVSWESIPGNPYGAPEDYNSFADMLDAIDTQQFSPYQTPGEGLMMASGGVQPDPQAQAQGPTIDTFVPVGEAPQGPTVVPQQPYSPMADAMSSYYNTLYSSNPYYQYYGDPYMFESVFDSGVYDPSGTGE